MDNFKAVGVDMSSYPIVLPVFDDSILISLVVELGMNLPEQLLEEIQKIRSKLMEIKFDYEMIKAVIGGGTRSKEVEILIGDYNSRINGIQVYVGNGLNSIITQVEAILT